MTRLDDQRLHLGIGGIACVIGPDRINPFQALIDDGGGIAQQIACDGRVAGIALNAGEGNQQNKRDRDQRGQAHQGMVVARRHHQEGVARHHLGDEGNTPTEK